jgi:uncharacterized lipoprotein YehR (DUF1307 family)
MKYLVSLFLVAAVLLMAVAFTGCSDAGGRDRYDYSQNSASASQ